ncbi:MAG: hypothetical protein HY872_07610 [Chloroflexi bacterium]|nr:hypothetical protein [Chloroflexota bacterium]MBI5830505.1 hypothetical protein [Chloroflexota bacterium]
MPKWEYCILTRLSWGVDTKWYVNRIYQHAATDMPDEVTGPQFRAYNDKFDQLYASKVYPILPAALNLLGADGWELLDDMNTGMTGGEGLVFKRPLAESPAAKPKAARKPVAKKKSARR